MITQIDKNRAKGLGISCCEVMISGLGEVYIGISGQKLCFLGFGDTARAVCERMFVGVVFDELPQEQAAVWGAKIERNWTVGEELELMLVGTDFQRKVWVELLKIERGQTVAYADIARAIGTNGVRAVGSAIGRNPLSLVVPCHRVVRSDGTMGGYLWGVEVKELILQKEKL